MRESMCQSSHLTEQVSVLHLKVTSGHGLADTGVLGSRLDWMVFEAFSNLSDSMIPNLNTVQEPMLKTHLNARSIT